MSERLVAVDIDTLFCEMLELTSDERTIELNRVAILNLELANNVRALFEIGTKAEALLDIPAADARDNLYEKIAEGWTERKQDDDVRIGDQVGPFTLTAVIGRGARSTVYKATRAGEEWHQTVAIKILRRGIDTDDVIARFHLERQILARLVHPGIASILDVGVTSDGLPYFAMEQIEGKPVSEHCDELNLPIRARLTLFLQIADTVSFAHRHLVVHRDIKPSNILVDAESKATLLDFGISKLLDPNEKDAPSVHTRTDVRPLTPDYAAPEQIAGEVITTATDIYQLGVLLAKILTGVLPQGDDGEVSEDMKKLPLDLQTIISKATRIEPQYRYLAVHDLMQDIERYLDDLPILARAPTFMYRMQKFIQRRPWAFPVAALSILGIIAYMVMVTIYADRLQIERDLKAAEADRADEIKSYLVDFMRAPDPYEGEGFDVTVQQALANAAANAETELTNRPELQAEIFATLAEVYGNLDIHAEAAKYWEKYTEILGSLRPDSLAWLKGRREYGYSMFRTEQKDIAITELDNTIQALEARQPLPLVDLAITLIYRAEIESEIGNMDQAVAMLESAVERSRQAGSVGEHQLATALGTIGLVYSNKGEREAALEALNEAIAINTKLHGQNSLPVTQTRMSYG
ncbi:MAG: serine/threonine protein kinase, partial [Emcibacter sp.]|nr:serine/threonine protein kinase [Emcibacter sp.]